MINVHLLCIKMYRLDPQRYIDFEPKMATDILNSSCKDGELLRIPVSKTEELLFIGDADVVLFIVPCSPPSLISRAPMYESLFGAQDQAKPTSMPFRSESDRLSSLPNSSE